MKLLLRRSQRTGRFSSAVIFCLDARVQFTAEEETRIARYRLENQVIYNSQAAERHIEHAAAATAEGTMLGGAKAIASYALASLRLNITIGSLALGHHIECKDMQELLAAEEALRVAMLNLRAYLDNAATFAGSEVLVEYEGDEERVVAQSVGAEPALPAGGRPKFRRPMRLGWKIGIGVAVVYLLITFFNVFFGGPPSLGGF